MRFWLPAVVLATALVAQNAPEVEITAEPHHHLALENSYVRVFKADIPPGDATLLHRHHHDYLSVNLGSAQISNQVEGKPPVTAKLQDGQTAFGQAPLAHVVRDLAATPFRNVTIEFLQDDKAHRAPSAPWDEERGLHILEGGTQHIMFVQDRVRVSEVDLQPGGMVPKHHHSGPHLLVAVTDLELENDVAGKGTSQINLKAGDIKWVPGGFTHTLMNAGKQPAKFVILEFR